MEPSPFCAEFGRRVQRRRRILGLKQGEVAQHVGVHRSHITQLEGGGYQSMKFEQLARLAEILETSTDYLLQRTEEDPGVIPPWLCPGEASCLHSSSPPLQPHPLGGGHDHAKYSTGRAHGTVSMGGRQPHPHGGGMPVPAPRRPAVSEHESRRHFLDTPYILQIVALEQMADLLRPLAADSKSPLPVRMRNQLARMHNRVRALSRELRDHPEAVQRERAAEEPPPPGGDGDAPG